MQKRILFFLVCFISFLSVNTVNGASLEVFVSIPPQKWLVEQLGGDLVTAHVLIGKGQEPHTFQPTPRQITSLGRAKLYFSMEMDFEKAVLPKLVHSSSLKRVNTTRSVDKTAMKGPGNGKKHDHFQSGLDPHVWLSPKNLQSMASVMALEMAAMDESNKEIYAANLKKLDTLLSSLDKEIQQKLAPFHGASVYVFHPAFGYFTSRYHLHQQAVEIEGKAPTPKQLASLISRAKADKVKVIFVQPQFDPAGADVIASAIGGKVIALDPLAEDVPTNLRQMAEAFYSALNDR